MPMMAEIEMMYGSNSIESYKTDLATTASKYLMC